MAGRTASEIKAAEMALRALKGEKAVAEMLGRPVSNNSAKTAANAAAAKRAAAAARLNQLYAESLSPPPLSERAKALLVNIPEETRKQNTERLKKALLPVITRRKQTNEFGNSHKLQPLPTFRGVGRGIIGARRIQAAALPNLKNVGNNSRATALALKAEQNARAAIAARRATKKVPFGGAIEEDPSRQAAVGLTYNIMGRVMSKAKANNEAAAAAKRNRNEVARRVFLRRKGKGPTPLSLPAPRPARPTVNTTVLATTLTRAIKSALAKRPTRGAAPPTLNTRALASTLAVSIKKALGARKATAGINTRGLSTALSTALKKANTRRPVPMNTSALAGTLARAITSALAKRQPAPEVPERKSTQNQAPEVQRKSNQKQAPEVPAPKINKNSLVKSLTNALKRAFAPSAAAPARQTGGEREGLGGRVFYRIGANGKPYLSLERTSPLSNFTRPAVAANYVNITNYKNQVKKSSIKNWERLFINKNDWKKWTNGKGNQKPPPLGALGTKGRQAGPVVVNGNKFQQRPGGATTTTTSVTGPTITGPTITGPTVTGPTVTGPTVTGPTVTVGAPNIKIQLNGLVKATEQARADPNKTANLARAVANLRAKLSNGSEAKKALNVLFPAKVNLGPATVPTPAEVKKVMNNAVVKEVTKKQAATQAYKPTTPPAGKSVKNMSFRELLAMRRTAKNRTEINRYLRQDVESELRKISRLSSSERGWRLGELYRSLPESLPARAVVLRAIQAEVRRVGRERDPVEAKRRLRDLYSNLGMGRSVPRELAREFKTQNMRALTNYKRQEERYARRYGGSLREGREMYRTMRPQGEVALMQRAPSVKPVVRELALRQGGARLVPSLKGPQIFAGPRPLAEGVSLKLPTGIPGPVLPSNQTAAINKAGGPTQALKVVAAVPGGAPAVARAAADLNEMGGNVKRAQELKGTPTAAIKAVQKLGGAKTASYALEGLNTLAQSKKTQVRKAKKTGRKVKKAPVRLHELNRVIEAVKRKKLVSLVSHNVANVNNSKKKKYYKKVIKSFILKKPLASKIQAAAKKNKS